MLDKISDDHVLSLYSASEIPEVLMKDSILLKGTVDYVKEMPIVFASSKININITIRSIESGIPQRVFDILASGGFCLTNYQSGIADCFEDGIDLVMYTSEQDLIDKIAYYLEHEDERIQIAESGHNKAMQHFNLINRLDEVFIMIQDIKKREFD